MENGDNWRHSFECAIPDRIPCVVSFSQHVKIERVVC